MPQTPNKPPFIVIEGLDGAGTTTQSALLVERLQAEGRPALLTREPSDGPIGALIRQMLSMRVVTPATEPSQPPAAVSREVLALLFAGDRLDHLRAEVEPALAAGKIVVSDRYYHSSFAYQGDARLDEGGSDELEQDELDLRWVQSLNERARVPDLTIFLEASVDLCLSRMSGRGRRDIFETREHLTDLERRYDQVMRTLEARGERVVRLDAALERDVIADEIDALIAAKF
jgi:dTMP kinase